MIAGFFAPSVRADTPPLTDTVYTSYGTHLQHDPNTYKPFETLRKYSTTTRLVDRSWDLLAQLDQEIAKKLPAGSQVMIFLDTHGAPNGSQEYTHSIGLDDGIMSLDKIQSRLQKLASQGVNIALMDMSCFSSSTQKFTDTSPALKKHLCVVSGDSVNLTSIAQFNEAMIKNIGPEKSIEDVYLSARTAGPDDTNAPTLSTDASRSCGKALSEVATIMGSASWLNYQKLLRLKKTKDCENGPYSSQPVVQDLISNLTPIFGKLDDNDEDIGKIYEAFNKLEGNIEEQISLHPGLADKTGDSVWLAAVTDHFNAFSDVNLWQGTIDKKIDQLPKEQLSTDALRSIVNQINHYDPETYRKLSDENPTLKSFLSEQEPYFRESQVIKDAVNSGELKKMFPDYSTDDLGSSGIHQRLVLGSAERGLYQRCYREYQAKHPPAPGAEVNACQAIKFH